jgi:hypothetical protein
MGGRRDPWIHLGYSNEWLPARAALAAPQRLFPVVYSTRHVPCHHLTNFPSGWGMLADFGRALAAPQRLWPVCSTRHATCHQLYHAGRRCTTNKTASVATQQTNAKTLIQARLCFWCSQVASTLPPSPCPPFFGPILPSLPSHRRRTRY